MVPGGGEAAGVIHVAVIPHPFPCLPTSLSLPATCFPPSLLTPLCPALELHVERGRGRERGGRREGGREGGSEHKLAHVVTSSSERTRPLPPSLSPRPCTFMSSVQACALSRGAGRIQIAGAKGQAEGGADAGEVPATFLQSVLRYAQVVTGIINNNMPASTRLAVVPMGDNADFSSSQLGIPRNPLRALRLAATGHALPIDVGIVNKTQVTVQNAKDVTDVTTGTAD